MSKSLHDFVTVFIIERSIIFRGLNLFRGIHLKNRRYLPAYNKQSMHYLDTKKVISIMKLNHWLFASFLVSSSVLTLSAQALTLSIPASGDVVGHVQTAIAKPGDTLAQIARNYDMGFTELTEANPGLNQDHVPPGTVVVIPSQFVLPNAPREGLVVNLAEMRLYYYPGNGKVVTHPLGIGREGEDTPVGVLKIVEHIPNPLWTPTKFMKDLRAKEGVTLPDHVAGGSPENPLGLFAMRLSNRTFLIHGTNDPLGGIGRRSSSGCMRLYPEDIQSLFHQVKNGTNVYIVNEPYKAGWLGANLYIESHVALEGDVVQAVDDQERIRHVIQLATKNHSINLNWDKALEISSETQGLPQQIGQAG